MITRKTLYDGLRQRFGAFDDVQVHVINATLDEWERRKLTDLRWLAYMLATMKGECDFRPVREIGRGRGKPYGKAINGRAYYGRGLVQLTWLHNYEKLGALLNLPLVSEPDLALDVDVAVAIMFEGMIHGHFTGKKLSDYFSVAKNDPVNARRIINGTDKAKQFARWHEQILAVLIEATRVSAAPAPLPATPLPDRPRQEPARDSVEPGPRPGTAAGGADPLTILVLLVAIAAAIGMIILFGIAAKGL